ncbi:methyltransferase-like protein 27 [Tubulanus polymorphus]|uniref:methyltransferase-like protein 27 n=1 Tax=Tubulanus polymorphus TaxID=672921 RepID=UPI003DA2F13E
MSRTGKETVEYFHEKVFTCKDPEKMKSIYDEWNFGYSKDLKSASYKGPVHTAHMVHRFVNDKNCTICDVGAGTGLVAEELRKLGFTGRMDAIDPSTGMAKEAIEKKLYNKFYHEYLIPGQQCSVETESYDNVTCCGSIIPGHVRYQCIAELLRICKPGGHVVVTLRKDYLDMEEFVGMDQFLKNLEKNGTTSMTVVHEFPQYYLHYPALVFVLKKKASFKQRM